MFWRFLQSGEFQCKIGVAVGIGICSRRHGIALGEQIRNPVSAVRILHPDHPPGTAIADRWGQFHRRQFFVQIRRHGIGAEMPHIAPPLHDLVPCFRIVRGELHSISDAGVPRRSLRKWEPRCQAGAPPYVRWLTSGKP